MSSAFSIIQSAYVSGFLQREVGLTIILPPGQGSDKEWPLVLFNDGQDFDALKIVPALAGLHADEGLPRFVTVGIHAGHDRIHEYGTAARPDYAGRGSRAGATTSFVINELIPFLSKTYHTRASKIVYAGFSLGGLMALDAAWNHSGVFAAAGVFSGSLWWRQKALGEGYSDSDRIMHHQIRECTQRPAIQCWFQCGSLDENDDRDGDGVIDSIQDTLECISEMERKGFRWAKDVFYTEMAGGKHDTQTWAASLPDFFRWIAARDLI